MSTTSLLYSSLLSPSEYEILKPKIFWNVRVSRVAAGVIFYSVLR